MSWQLALVVMVLASTTTMLIRRHYSQKSTVPATFPAAASYIFGVLPVGITASLLAFPHIIHWSWWLVMLLVLCGSSMAISVSTGFRAAGQLTVAANMTIGRTTSILTILMGWVLLGEGLTTWQLVGGAILLAAALLAIWAPAKTDAGSFKHLHPSTVLLALASCATLAIGLVTEKAALDHMQIGGIFLVGWTAQALAMVLLATKDFSRHTFRAFYGRELKWSALMGAANGTTGVFYIYAVVHSDNISLISALTAIILPLTVFGAYVFLHEREHHKIMWLSLGISLIGLLVSGIR
jgi:drug/metabolite transporter (DMT)-like permease